MDMNVDVDPDWGLDSSASASASASASDRGAGALGFSGTIAKGGQQATGLTTLSDDGFGDGLSMPMLPSTWAPSEK
jgi:PPE-repeat protein